MHLIIGELEQGGGWICARRQDKDERRHAAAVAEGGEQVERRRLHELSADLLGHELHDRRNHFVGSQRTKNEQALELTQAFFVDARQRCVMRLLEETKKKLMHREHKPTHSTSAITPSQHV